MSGLGVQSQTHKSRICKLLTIDNLFTQHDHIARGQVLCTLGKVSGPMA